jgi:hypothetical protein
MALEFTNASTGAGVWGVSTWDSAALWGPLNAITNKLIRRSQKGHAFSVEFTNSVFDQSWAVYGLVFQIQGVSESPNKTNVYPGGP